MTRYQMHLVRTVTLLQTIPWTVILLTYFRKTKNSIIWLKSRQRKVLHVLRVYKIDRYDIIFIEALHCCKTKLNWFYLVEIILHRMQIFQFKVSFEDEIISICDHWDNIAGPCRKNWNPIWIFNWAQCQFHDPKGISVVLTILCLRTTNLYLFKTYTVWEYISVMHSYFTSPKSLKQCNQCYFW